MNIIRLVIFAVIFYNASIAHCMLNRINDKNYFKFVISKIHTDRQNGQVLNIYVKYAYKKKLSANKYFDYIKMRNDVLAYMTPSKTLPIGVYWEVIAQDVAKKLFKKYPIEGLSIQFEVIGNDAPNRYEPGNHGPIYTIGVIEPLDK